MRFLHFRNDHARGGAAAAQSLPVRERDPRAHDSESLPMWHPYANPCRGAQGRWRSEVRGGRLPVTGGEPMTASHGSITRRRLLTSGGAVVVTFSLARSTLGQSHPPSLGPRQPQPPRLPGSLRTTPMLDAWIRVDRSGITVFTGQAELGQGVKTALLQIAAEELAVEPGQIDFITADTGRTPNEEYTSGSQSMPDSGTAIRNAAAQVRELLISFAAAAFGAAPEQLTARDATVTTTDDRSASYGRLASAERPH